MLSLLVGAAACSGQTETDPGAGVPTDSSSPGDTAGTVGAGPSEPGPLPDAVVGADCRPAPGRRVTQLDDVRVDAVEVPPVLDEDGEVAIEGFTIPAQLVDAGCVIRFDAAGGCLGAVTITAATIPAATIPASVLPEAELPEGEVVDAQEFPEAVAPEVSRPASFSPEVCQAQQDGELLTVSRAGAVREGFSRSGVARSGGSRGRQCDGEGCVAGVFVPTVRLEPVRLPDVDVDPGRLESRTLPGASEVDVLAGEGRVSYVAPSRVLFATDSSRIRPEADESLAAILRRIRAAFPDGRLLIEGLTDDRASRRYNLDLSRRRADAVADWFVEAGFPGSRIRTRGLGEADPVVPNTSAANRAQNRRVVITVL